MYKAATWGASRMLVSNYINVHNSVAIYNMNSNEDVKSIRYNYVSVSFSIHRVQNMQ